MKYGLNSKVLETEDKNNIALLINRNVLYKKRCAIQLNLEVFVKGY